LNVTIIRPPVYCKGFMGAQLVPVLGIAYVAASALKAGHRVDVIDMCGEGLGKTEKVHGSYVSYGMSFSELEARMKNTELIAFSLMFSQDWPFNRELIRHCRTLWPESIFVAGGEHATALPEYILKDCPELDICVMGEGDIVFPELLERIGSGIDFDEIKGIAYRREGAVKINERQSRVSSVDELPLPAWELFPIDKYLFEEKNYHVRRGRTMPMLASRGCPFRCFFCSNENMWGKPWLPRKPDLIVEEMLFYREKYKVRNFIFSDLSAVVHEKNLVKMCELLISKKLNITWQMPTLRLDKVKPETLFLMHKAGCMELDFAIESGSENVLYSAGKKISPAELCSKIGHAVDIGINTCANIIVGMPSEKFRDLLKTIFTVLKLAFIGLHELNVFPFVPYPGSKYFREYLEKGKIELNDNYFLSLYGYSNIGKSVSWSENFSPFLLSSIRFLIIVLFYSVSFSLRPGRFLRFTKGVFTGRGHTKLENVVSKMFSNIRYGLKKNECNSVLRS